MECRDFIAHLDDYLDGQATDGAAREHLAGCSACSRRYKHALAVQSALRKLTPPEAPPEFVERAIARATRPAAAHPRRRAVLGMALAASLALGLGLGAFFTMRDAPVQTVTLAVDRPETVRLVFSAAKPLQAATLSLALPENVDLVGYAGRRELTWQTDLREGQNLLQLPLVAHGAVKDDLLAKLSHGSSSKTFKVRFEIAKSGAPGM